MTIGSGVLRVDVGAGKGREFHAVEQDSAIKGNDVPVHAVAWMDQDLFPFLWLNTVPLHGYALLHFSMHPLMDRWIVTILLVNSASVNIGGDRKWVSGCQGLGVGKTGRDHCLSAGSHLGV